MLAELAIPLPGRRGRHCSLPPLRDEITAKHNAGLLRSGGGEA